MRNRFETAADVYVAFPMLEGDVLAKSREEPPFEFMRRIADGATPEDAMSFFAYFAPKREAVWWSCRCVRALGIIDEPAALEATQRWVETPEEEPRRIALRLADESSPSFAPTWCAYAAAWSGGNIAVGNQPPMAAAPHMTAKAVRAAVLIAISAAPAEAREERLERCLAEAIRVADDEL